MLLRPIVPDRDGYPLGGDRGEKSCGQVIKPAITITAMVWQSRAF
jgi:hypothetical protein